MRNAPFRLGLALSFASACGLPAPPASPRPPASPPATADPALPPAPALPAAPDAGALAAKIARFVPVTLNPDVAGLPPSERRALDEVIAAAKLLEPAFERQAWAGNPSLRTRLEADTSPGGKLRFEYFTIMRGPWDRQDHFTPFATDRERPKGAGFYPEDLTADAFRAYLGAHPGERAGLESMTTVVRREGERLVAVPYHEAYKAWLGPVAERLERAAGLTADAGLRTFLASRAGALRSGDYAQSERDWMLLSSPFELALGPYDTFEDGLMGLKGAFKAIVTVDAPGASARLERYKKFLPDMERNLPVPPEARRRRGAESRLHVGDLAFSAGDARKSVQGIALNLPNDERLRAENGFKTVLLRNLIEAKFNAVTRPIGERVLDPSQYESLSAEAFFYHMVFHEFAHGLGPGLSKRGGEFVEVRAALEAAASTVEEAKADAAGVLNALYMIKRGELPKGFARPLLTSYFAGLVRGVRFGLEEAHARGAALQINRYLKAGAARFDAASGRFTVDFERLPAAAGRLVRELCLLQHAGDRAGAEALLDAEGVMSEPIRAAIARLEGVPIDVRLAYPLAGESPAPPR